MILFGDAAAENRATGFGIVPLVTALYPSSVMGPSLFVSKRWKTPPKAWSIGGGDAREGEEERDGAVTIGTFRWAA